MSTSGFAGFCLKTSGYSSPGLASKLASAADGARGAIAEFASRLNEVIDGQMDFGPVQDGVDTFTPRY